MKEDIIENFSDLKEELKDYAENRFNLIRLHVVEQLSCHISGFIVKGGILYILFFGLIFLSMALAFFLGELFESYGLGFLIVAGIYFLIALIFYLLRKVLIEKPVIKSFIKLFFPNFENNGK